MVDEKTYHLINDYLNGDLQGTTLDIFKSRLNSEKGLRRAVSEQKAIIAALNTVREQELRDILKSDNKKKKVIAIGPYLRTAGLAAAAIAILVVAFFSIRPYITDSADTNTAQESKAKPQQTLEKPEPITEDSNLIADNPAIETTTIDTQTLAIIDPIPLVEKMLEEEYGPSVESRGDAGFLENITSGLGAGAVGMYESAALGGAALLEEEEELKAREKIQSAAEYFRPSGGNREALSYKLASGIGSIGALLPTAFLGPAALL